MMDVLPNNIHELAKVMVSEGFIGQGMQNDQAGVYIFLAADNPDVERELPPNGLKFWKIARANFRLWRARKKIDDAGRAYARITAKLA